MAWGKMAYLKLEKRFWVKIPLTKGRGGIYFKDVKN